MAMAEKFLREKFGPEVQNHFTYAIVSDGDLMEGIAAEAASLAGQLGLGRLVYLYDDNGVTLDGPASLSFTAEDRAKRFEAYGWHTLTVEDANDLDELRHAIHAGQAEQDRPTLISVKSIIGYPSPQKGTSEVHGKALGEDNVRATKEKLGWDPDATFHVPDGVYEAFAPERGERLQAEWQRAPRRARRASLRKEWDAAWAAKPVSPVADVLPKFEVGTKVATRSAGGKIMAAFEPVVPTMVGGAADLSESTKTSFPASEKYTKEAAGPQRLLRRPRARHGRRGQRHGRRTAASSGRTARRSCSSPTTCAARSACRRSWACTRCGCSPTTRSRSARTARRTSRSSTTWRCARSPGWCTCARPTRPRPPRRGA